MATAAGAALQLPAPTLTEEDLLRSADRARVEGARRKRRRLALFWLLIGPGILAMLGENDGPSMLSYTATGAQYGVGFFLPFIFVTFLFAYLCQEMVMRVGAVTHRGYGQLVLERYGHFWGWFAALDLLFTNLVTLVGEFVAVRVGIAYFLGNGGASAPIAAGVGLVLVAVALSFRRYWRWERLLLGLAVLNGLFLPAALLTRPHWAAVGQAVASFGPLPRGSLNTVLLLIASTLGATVTPWMVFFQQSASTDKGLTPRDIRYGRSDTLLGALLAACFGGAALLAGAALHGFAAPALGGAAFPSALAHHLGSTVGTLFALGLIEAGTVALLAISASTAYAAGECVGGATSFNNSFRRAAFFYGVNLSVVVVAAAVVMIPGAPLLAIALNANVLATVLLPVTLVFLLLLANDGELMGRFRNGRGRNLVGGLIVAVVSAAGAAYAIDSFLQASHLAG